jgi:hypothetical protein
VCIAIGGALGGAVGCLLLFAGRYIRPGAALVIALSCWVFLYRERRRLRREEAWRANLVYHLRRSGRAHLN